MSLWTPGGEHEVPREPADQPGPTQGADNPVDDLSRDQLLSLLSPEDRAHLASLSPDEQARAEAMLRQQFAEMAEVQARMIETPAAMVVANHAMGLYELATIHLRQSPPNFAEATVAIDAFAALVESLKGRLGAEESTLGDALAQIRLAYVQLKAAVEGAGAEGNPEEQPG